MVTPTRHSNNESMRSGSAQKNQSDFFTELHKTQLMDEHLFGTKPPPRKRGRSIDPFDEDYSYGISDILIDDDPFSLNSGACWDEELVGDQLTQVSRKPQQPDAGIVKREPPPTRPHNPTTTTHAAKPTRPHEAEPKTNTSFRVAPTSPPLAPLAGQSSQNQAVLDTQHVRLQSIKVQIPFLRLFNFCSHKWNN